MSPERTASNRHAIWSSSDGKAATSSTARSAAVRTLFWESEWERLWPLAERTGARFGGTTGVVPANVRFGVVGLPLTNCFPSRVGGVALEPNARLRPPGDVGLCGVALRAHGDIGRCGVALLPHGPEVFAGPATATPTADGGEESCRPCVASCLLDDVGDSSALCCRGRAGGFFSGCCAEGCLDIIGGVFGVCRCCCEPLACKL